TADLVVGPGTGMISVPSPWTDAEPDFSTASTMLRMHPHYPFSPGPDTVVYEEETDSEHVEWWDW
ncbi:hypothetical protein, partial [Acinetobacter baumannii]